MATRLQQMPEAFQRHHSERAAEEQPQISTQASQPRPPSQVGSQTSEDSQTVVLNHSDAQAKPADSKSSQDGESLHCWICLMDEPLTEREAGNWKEPCSCNLTAHEECLFQWIASQEDDQKIECPQCKTRINIAQPYDLFLELGSKIRRIVESCVVPTGMVAFLGITYTGLLVYGQNTVTLIFGSREAREMFYSGVSRQRPRFIRGNSSWDAFRRTVAPLSEAAKVFLDLYCPFFPPIQGEMNWISAICLPLVAPVLVLSRLRVADDMFTLLPAAYSIFQVLSKRPYDIMEWPPSPGLTLASLPFCRICYTEAYKYFFSDLEKKWNQAVQRQPREGETAEEVAAQAAAAREEQHELELGIEVMPADDEDTDEEDEEDEEQRGELQAEFLNRIQQRLDQQANENPAILVEELDRLDAQLNARQQEVIAALQNNLDQGRPELHVVGEPAPAAERRANALEGRLNLATDGLGTTVFGALFFPAISWCMGSLLKLTFPKTWVSQPYVIRNWSSEKLSWSKGFLQTRFGRSIAGGCLFIVLKDAAVLYYKWKRAKDVGKRRILNYKERDDGRRAG